MAPPRGEVTAARADWPPSFVRLNIYNIAESDVLAGVNDVLHAVGTGAFHAGVEVYSSEWSFGNTPGPTRSGIFRTPPRTCDDHKFRESIVMGETSLSEKEVHAIIGGLAPRWDANSYDLLRRNCCHFADALCIQLGVGPVPEWVTSLAGVGAMLQSLLFGGDKEDQDNCCGALAPTACRGDPLAALHPHGAPRLPPHGPNCRLEPFPAFDSTPLPVIALAAADPIEWWSCSEESCSFGHEDTVPVEWVDLETDTPAVAGFGHKMLPVSHQRVRCCSRGKLSGRQPRGDVDDVAVPGPGEDIQPIPDEPLVDDNFEVETDTEEMAARVSLCKGTTVEIYSTSRRTWCRGRVYSVRGKSVKVVYTLDGTKDVVKELPLNHQHVRLPRSRASRGASALRDAGDAGDEQEGGVAVSARSSTATTLSAPSSLTLDGEPVAGALTDECNTSSQASTVVHAGHETAQLEDPALAAKLRGGPQVLTRSAPDADALAGAAVDAAECEDMCCDFPGDAGAAEMAGEGPPCASSHKAYARHRSCWERCFARLVFFSR